MQAALCKQLCTAALIGLVRWKTSSGGLWTFHINSAAQVEFPDEHGENQHAQRVARSVRPGKYSTAEFLW